MKAWVLDPLVLMAARLGYSRPLDRHDFPHGHIPDSVSHVIPGVGELVRHANLTAIPTGASAVGTQDWTTDQKHALGTLAFDKVGNFYRYCRAGAVALVAGNTIQSSAVVANHFGLTAAVEAIGAGGPGDPIVVTPGATAGEANLYAEGDLFVSVTPGLGKRYRVSGHPAISSSTAFNLFLDPDDLLTNDAFSTSTRYGLLANRFKNVIQFPVTTATGSLSGIAVSPIAINNYGWLQTKGIANVLITGTPALGAEVMCPGTVAGAAQVVVAAGTLIVAQMIGHMAKVGVDGETNPVHVRID